MRYKFFWPIGWALLILAVSLLPADHPVARASTLGGLDTMAHIFAYCVLALLVFYAMRDLSTGVGLGCAIAIPASLGVFVEIVQPALGRAGSWKDVAANGAGVAVGAVLGSLWATLSRRESDETGED
ncbi:MAG: VanZ family protein [Planctomycetes bacterium]|nr:VanZ family protein [Planctomycetota bacterium]